MELYKRFRGQEPKADALLKHWADLEIKTKVMRRISCFMIILMLVS
jgi:hypothetical protein